MPRRFLPNPGSLVSLLCTAVLLGGCGNGLGKRQAELCQWIGRPETALVQALGAPARSYETDGIKVLTYEDRRVDIIPGTAFYPGYGRAGWGAGAGLPPQAVNLTCDTNFTIAGGLVKSFSLRGNACGDSGAACPRPTAGASHDRLSFRFEQSDLARLGEQRLLAGLP
jgi:hypothetical protein